MKHALVKILFGSMIIFLFFGCSREVHHLSKSDGSNAVIIIPQMSGIILTRVDDVKGPNFTMARCSSWMFNSINGWGAKVYLPPGKHTLTMCYETGYSYSGQDYLGRSTSRYTYSSPVTIELEVKEGKTYIVSPKINGNHWQPEIR
jgi:hypothetical protein